MDILLVNEGYVLCCTVISFQILNMICLDSSAFFNDSFVGWCNALFKETFPFRISELVVVQYFELFAKIVDECFFFMYLKVFIPLYSMFIVATEKKNKFFFEIIFTLVLIRFLLFWDIF